MSVFGPRPGCWWFASKSDPRWDVSGNTEDLSIFAMPREAAEALAQKKAELGEPPADLEYGCMKD